VLYATAGVHPHDAKNWKAETEGKLEGLLHNRFVVAAGECGLDYDRDYSPRDVQREVFARQVALAAREGVPLFTHERAAHADFLAILKEAGGKTKAVVHCFTGSREELTAYLDAGFYIGLTAWITDDRRGAHLRDLVSLIPRDRLMIETDAPYISPRDMPNRPRRNEPMYVKNVCDSLARYMGIDAEELAETTTRNAIGFFGLE